MVLLLARRLKPPLRLSKLLLLLKDPPRAPNPPTPRPLLLLLPTKILMPTILKEARKTNVISYLVRSIPKLIACSCNSDPLTNPLVSTATLLRLKNLK